MTPHSQETFKFKRQELVFAGALWVDCIFAAILFLVWSHRRGPVRAVDLMFSLMVVTILFLSVSVFRRNSKIIVDDEGISRTLLGWTWYSIRWDRIGRITVLPYFDPVKRKNTKAITIYPIAKPKLRVSVSGGTGFPVTDELIGAEKLIAMLNFYAARHKIKIETIGRGAKVSTTSI